MRLVFVPDSVFICCQGLGFSSCFMAGLVIWWGRRVPILKSGFWNELRRADKDNNCGNHDSDFVVIRHFLLLPDRFEFFILSNGYGKTFNGTCVLPPFVQKRSDY